MNEDADLILDAWDSEAICFPQDPHTKRLRWFLRTGKTTKSQRSAVIIGMNPSTAVELGLRRDGCCGDRTTDKLLKRFSRRHLERTESQSDEPVFDELAIVNLIPHVGRAKELPCWDDLSVSLPLKESIRLTKDLWERVLADVTDVILIWGKPGDSKYPWKTHLLEELEPFLKDNLGAKTLWAVRSTSAPHFPYHPRYPPWRTLPLEDVYFA